MNRREIAREYVRPIVISSREFGVDGQWHVLSQLISEWEDKVSDIEDRRYTGEPVIMSNRKELYWDKRADRYFILDRIQVLEDRIMYLHLLIDDY